MAKHSVQIQRDEHDENLNAKKMSLVSAATIYAVTGGGGAGVTTVFQGGAPWDTTINGNVEINATTKAHADGTSNSRFALLTDSNTVYQPVYPYVFNGTTWDRLRGSTNGIDINDISAGTQTNNINVAPIGNVTLSDSKTYIGLATVSIGAENSVSVVGNLTVHDPNLIDSNNSSTSTLIADAVYTGTGTDVSQYSTVTTQIDSSHDSATNGLTLQFSTDNTNWDDVYTFTYTASDGARRFQLPVTAQYFRVVYTNGGTGQTHFRLQTILHSGNTLTSIHRLVDDVKPDRSAQLVKSSLIAQINGSGDFTPIQATASGILKIGGSVDVDSLAGNVTLSDAKTYIGLTTTTLGTGLSNIGFATVAVSNLARTITGNVTLSDAKTYVGLVTATAINAGTSKTLIPKVIALSSSSIATVVVPTNTFYITHLLLNSNATVRVSIKSGPTYLTGNASIGITLNPGGGWVENGSPDSPIYDGLANAGAVVIEKLDLTGTAASIGGKFIYFEE